MASNFNRRMECVDGRTGLGGGMGEGGVKEREGVSRGLHLSGAKVR